MMTQEEKELLLKDLCARLPYHPILHFDDKVLQYDEYLYGFRENGGKFLINDAYYVEDVKPYLRPMPSMTEEEENEYRAINCYEGLFPHNEAALDYALKHHLDFRGLIPMGLVLEAPEGMYKNE